MNASYFSDMEIVKNAIPNIQKLDNTKILITGANGLIGSALVDFLDYYGHGVGVYAAVRTRKKFDDRFSQHKCHFVEYEACSDLNSNIDFDYVIHAASPANPKCYSSQPVETIMVNILGLNKIADYSLAHNVKRFLYVSSSEVYGRVDQYKAFSEADMGFVEISSPRSCYPSAKRTAETLLSAYRHEYGLDYTIVRPGHIYGPTANFSDTRASTAFFYDVLAGNDIVMKSAGLQKRSYCYVLDCVSAMLAVLISGESGEAYNISNDESVCTIRALAECIASSSGHSVIFECPNEIEKNGYNKMENSVLDATKLKGLGWKGQFDLVTGVKHTLDSLGKVF